MEASWGFVPGAVSIGLYATGADAGAQVASVVQLTQVAERAGFDGVGISEHHAGFSSYLPSPLMVASWLLAESERLWVAACPVLLPLRPGAGVAEDTAWLAARHPRRIVLGVAPGYVTDDFVVADADLEGARRNYWDRLPQLVADLSGGAIGPLANDLAIAACAQSPVPVLSSASGPVGARRAARAGAGVIFGSFTPPARSRELFDTYLAAGGDGPRALIRRCWLGPLREGAMDDLLHGYQGATGNTDHLSGGQTDQVVLADSPEQMAESIATVLKESHGTSLSLRFHFPGILANETADQIQQFGEQALPLLRERLRDGLV